MNKSPEGQYRLAVDQINEAFVRKGNHAGQQLGEHHLVALHLIGIRAQQRGTQLSQKSLERFQLCSRGRTLFFGRAAPRNHITRHIAVPVNVVAHLIAFGDGQVQGHVRVFAPDRFAQLQGSSINRLAGFTQGGERPAFATA